MSTDYTFNFTKDPPFPYITKKYFVELIWVGIDENYIIDCKDFDTFKEACEYNNIPQEEGVGYVFRNRRFICQNKLSQLQG